MNNSCNRKNNNHNVNGNSTSIKLGQFRKHQGWSRWRFSEAVHVKKPCSGSLSGIGNFGWLSIEVVSLTSNVLGKCWRHGILPKESAVSTPRVGSRSKRQLAWFRCRCGLRRTQVDILPETLVQRQTPTFLQLGERSLCMENVGCRVLVGLVL